MPTDEQGMRFEKWFTDIVLRRISEPGQRFERDDVGGYIDPTVHDMWRGYVAGEQARDAEVQALREELLNYVSADEMAVGEGYGTYPNSEHRRIRALVAGGEIGGTE